MRCVLGIDGGGTKCHVILARDDGTVLGWAKTDPREANPEREFGGHGRSHRAILSTITEAIGENDYQELHISSVVSQLPMEFLPNGHPTQVQVYRVGEPHAAFLQAGVSFGICALAGTGALVHGWTRDKRGYHLDGLGPQVGDHGSGHEIGLRAIRATAQSGWHPRRKTSFANDVFKACGGRENDAWGGSLIGYMAAPRDRSEIARLARFVIAAANQGDAVAIQILQEAAASLASTVCDVVDQLHIRDEDYPLVGTGGVIAGSDVYWNHFCSLVRDFAPRFQPFRSDMPPVVGVTLAALVNMPGIDYEKVKARLFKSVRDHLKSGKDRE